MKDSKVSWWGAEDEGRAKAGATLRTAGLARRRAASVVGGRIVDGLREKKKVKRKVRTGQFSVTFGHGVNRMSVLPHFLLMFSLNNIRSATLHLFSIFYRIFRRFFHARRYRSRGRDGWQPHRTPATGRLPKTVLALDHVQVPPRLLVTTHGRRYVFSQPILDHVCIGNAPHLENSRPGAQGSRVTHHQWTRQPGTVKTPPPPQSRSSSNKVHFSIPSKKNALRLRLLPTVKVASTVVLVSLLSPTLCFAPFALYSTSFLYSCPLSAFSLSHPFPPPFTLHDSHIQ